MLHVRSVGDISGQNKIIVCLPADKMLCVKNIKTFFYVEIFYT